MTKEYLEALDWLLANEMIYRGRTRLPISPALRDIKHRLESIDNANPSEALECWQWINATIPQWVREKDKEHPNVLEPIKQALLKAEQDKKKLNEIEKLTYLLYSKRRKIGQEYIKWCEKNNVVFDDATNMITWVLAIKLKEWLK